MTLRWDPLAAFGRRSLNQYDRICPAAHGLELPRIRDERGPGGRRAESEWRCSQAITAQSLVLERRARAIGHLPPGTSKWNQIEHRLFSHIAMNWRGKPLESLAAIVSLIGAPASP